MYLNKAPHCQSANTILHKERHPLVVKTAERIRKNKKKRNSNVNAVPSCSKATGAGLLASALGLMTAQPSQSLNTPEFPTGLHIVSLAIG